MWICVFFPGPLVISPLRQYTSYSVRIAGLNQVGVGLFSDTLSVRTLGMRKYMGLNQFGLVVVVPPARRE